MSEYRENRSGDFSRESKYKKPDFVKEKPAARKEKSGIGKGEFKKYHDKDYKAAGRTKSRCPVFGKCGGCSMIDTPMDEQIAEKQKFVEECIGRYTKVDDVIRMKNPGRYRNKVTSVFGIDMKRKPVCGVYRAHSKQIVPVKDCLIEDKRADSIVQSVFALLPSFKIMVYEEKTGYGLVRAVQVRTAHKTGQIMVTIVTNGPTFPSKNNFVKALLKEQPAITTIVQNINTQNTSMILGDREKVMYGPGYIEDELCGKRFRISSRSFYQVNSVQCEKLYNIAIDAAGLSGKELALDAYCGIGTIGICASDRCREVMSVELNPEAVKDAIINVKMNNAENVTVYRDDSGKFMTSLAEEGTRPDVLFMDPPRAGASEEFMAAACQMAPAKIVYISCNPVTLGENLAYLTSNGYKVKKAVPVDMFPYTREVETVCLLINQNA